MDVQNIAAPVLLAGADGVGGVDGEGGVPRLDDVVVQAQVCVPPVAAVLPGQVALKRGLIFQTASGPRLENCPSDSSMKKMGIPQMASMMK